MRRAALPGEEQEELGEARPHVQLLQLQLLHQLLLPLAMQKPRLQQLALRLRSRWLRPQLLPVQEQVVSRAQPLLLAQLQIRLLLAAGLAPLLAPLLSPHQCYRLLLQLRLQATSAWL